MLRAAPALLLLGACSATSPSTPAQTIAVYSPPVRIGGTGSVLFLPNTAAPTGSAAEVAVIVDLHRVLDRKGTVGCLNPMLVAPYISSGEREDAVVDLEEAGQRQPSKAAVRTAIIDGVRESWAGFGPGPAPLPAAVRIALLDAYADAVMAAPRKGRQMLLTQAMLPDDIRLRADCRAQLSRPTIRGDWAFVGYNSGTAAGLWALRREASGWTLVASNINSMF
ncbi:hypothetical protein ASE86_12375 [Sphingomonas sp. Leaf33]|uniref:hypothetical protein n=1 Tax=Sphingomonas sp. Leaf33 TaxID=1736215 RepID=UPI0006F442A4|nr:hypothetical protein [Sphingomonas sp. Leaf33]KQN19298.1 hypothetical protein ASE86_12375 [Sphingomonas sp. Leaf33]